MIYSEKMNTYLLKIMWSADNILLSLILHMMMMMMSNLKHTNTRVSFTQRFSAPF